MHLTLFVHVYIGNCHFFTCNIQLIQSVRYPHLLKVITMQINETWIVCLVDLSILSRLQLTDPFKIETPLQV